MRICTAAIASTVGMSPAHATTTSGSSPGTSVPAHSHTPTPRAPWALASSSDSRLAVGCLPAMTTLIRSVPRRQWSIVTSSEFASNGRYTRTISARLFTTWSRKPGSWCEKPLWSCRQTCEESRYVNDATGRRHSTFELDSSHFAYWLNIESTTWMNAS